MKTIIAIILLAAVAASAQYRIRVTDPDGNVSTATIAATGRVAKVSALVDDGMAALGTNRAERLAVWLEAQVVTNAIDHARAMRDIRLRVAYEAERAKPIGD